MQERSCSRPLAAQHPRQYEYKATATRALDCRLRHLPAVL